MKLKHISINCCLAAALLIGGTVACTDDHFDVQSVQNGGNTTESLWDIISSRSDLSDFKEVCQKAVYYTDEVTPSKNGYTFADLLKGNSQFTVFAPVNGTFDKEAMLALLETSGYDVHNQFLANHIARFRTEVVGQDTKKMNMLNGKILTMDMGGKTLFGAAIGSVNTPAKNGVLHTMEATVPFRTSIYEYLHSIAPTNDMAKYYCTGDTAEFRAAASIEGDIDVETGQMIYLDSVFNRTNDFFWSNVLKRYEKKNYYLPGTAAKLAAEDSSYVAFIPSNTAWQTALEKYRKLLRTAPVYADNYTRNQSEGKNDKRLEAVTDTMPETLGDDMALAYLQKSLFLNLGNTFRKYEDLNLDNFDSQKDRFGGIGYLVNTMGDTLRALPYAMNRNLDIPLENDVLGSDYDPTHVWDHMSIFDGKTPKRMSNGLVYEVDNLNFDPRVVVKRDIRIEGERSYYLCLTKIPQADGGQGGLSKYEDPAQGMWESFNKPTEQVMQKYGRVSNGFGFSEGKSTTPIYVAYGLRGDIYAGKYDIYVVTVPYAMVAEDSTLIMETGVTFDATLSYVTEDGPENKSLSKGTKLINEKDGKTTFTASGAKVDTVLLARDFEFPYCYVGQDNSWPVLQFKVNNLLYPDSKNKKVRLAIDFIYLKAKED